MLTVFDQARRVAMTETTVLVTGESGTGKELIAEAIHPFTGATDSRIGRFEAANRGTIFIDEIGDFAWESQAKLLRVLENRTVTPIGSNDDRSVDVRVVAATSRDLDAMVADGEFREDLYYRLNVVNLRLPRCANAAKIFCCWSTIFSGTWPSGWAAQYSRSPDRCASSWKPMTCRRHFTICPGETTT
jgi:transcriptional regulator with PAS, ATPase and Fis domain